MDNYIKDLDNYKRLATIYQNKTLPSKKLIDPNKKSSQSKIPFDKSLGDQIYKDNIKYLEKQFQNIFQLDDKQKDLEMHSATEKQLEVIESRFLNICENYPLNFYVGVIGDRVYTKKEIIETLKKIIDIKLYTNRQKKILNTLRDLFNRKQIPFEK